MNPNLADITKVFKIPLTLNAKAGDKILIITDTAMDSILWQGLSKAAEEMDIEPVVAIMKPRETHATDPIEPIRRAAMGDDLALCIYLTSTAMAHAPITEDLVRRGQRFILMEELTPAMLSPDGPAGADYHAINALGQKVAKIFTEGQTVRVRSAGGTDLTASIKGRPGSSIAGLPLRLRPDGGGGCAFPMASLMSARLRAPGRGRSCST